MARHILVKSKDGAEKKQRYDCSLKRQKDHLNEKTQALSEYSELPYERMLIMQFENKHPRWARLKTGKIETIAGKDIVDLETGGLIIPVSNQELAIVEILEAIPKLISFEHAAELFQGLVNLSPKKIQSLLERSDSIKANRLFLFLADFYQMPWRSRLDDTQINLGSGKRQIVKGGKLDKTYQITVPEKFIRHG